MPLGGLGWRCDDNPIDRLPDSRSWLDNCVISGIASGAYESDQAYCARELIDAEHRTAAVPRLNPSIDHKASFIREGPVEAKSEKSLAGNERDNRGSEHWTLLEKSEPEVARESRHKNGRRRHRIAGRELADFT